jgi:pyruvate ferredoxin oxidoreductase alpha subunit
MNGKNKQILEGSRAIAQTIKNIGPAVISAYPITPQTHIVEDLAKFKADGEGGYEFIRAESEFAAASIILGASATGVRVYSATCSQGILLMAEVIYNIAGMRLPIVMTCANRAISAPINIWNDQQDIMAVKEAGWILLFAENNQEAISQHIMAYKIAEKTKLPVMINIDGFILTHTYEPVIIPEAKDIKNYLGKYEPQSGAFLDPADPITLGAFATPAYYMEIREELHNDLKASQDIINKEYENYNKIFKIEENALTPKTSADNGLIEYYGPKKAKILLIAMGSVIGTIKETVDEINGVKSSLAPLVKKSWRESVGVLKIKAYRPFPTEELLKYINQAKCVAVIDKAISLGHMGPLASDIKAVAQSPSLSFGVHGSRPKIQSFIVGLGGRDITKEIIKKIIREVKREGDKIKFIGN